jgi:hypothetical protein
MRRGIAVFISLVGMVWLLAAVGSAVAAVPPPNDDLADAQALSGPLPLRVTGTTVGATREAAEPTHEDWVPAGHSVWYRWQAPRTEYISIDTCGSEQRETLVVYDGSAYGSLKEVAANGYTYIPGCTSGGESEVAFTAVAGHTYSISVDGDGYWSEPPSAAGEGFIELEVSRPAPPANDDFADATPVTAREGNPVLESGPTFAVDNHGATKEPGEPDHRGDPGGASVWFEWTAPRSGGVIAQGCNEGEGLVAVYTGSSVSTLTPVPQVEPTSPADTCDYSFFAQAGTTYRIAVDGKLNPSTGAAELLDDRFADLRYFPPNDDFDHPDALINLFTGAPYTNIIASGYFNLEATKQPGEPDHAGNAGGHSVWFSWTATDTGSVQISVCGSDFPTALAAYTGEAVDALTPVASGTGEGNSRCMTEGFGEIGFNTVAGTTYRIAVDGIDGAAGRFGIALGSSDEPEKPRPTATPSVAPAPTPPAARPTAKIAARHIDQSRGLAVFDLHSAQPGTHFRCRLDGGKFARCGAKVTYRHLAAGRHVFRAQAVGPTGARSAPVKAAFAIRRAR